MCKRLSKHKKILPICYIIQTISSVFVPDGLCHGRAEVLRLHGGPGGALQPLLLVALLLRLPLQDVCQPGAANHLWGSGDQVRI